MTYLACTLSSNPIGKKKLREIVVGHDCRPQECRKDCSDVTKQKVLN